MTGGVEKNPNGSPRKPETTFRLELVLADYCRRRWPDKAVEHVMAEWDLTRGQSQGAVYGTASRSTINAIIQHKRGGLRLLFALGCAATGQSLSNLIKTEIEGIENEIRRQQQVADELAFLEARLESDLDSGLARRISGEPSGGVISGPAENPPALPALSGPGNAGGKPR
jgi:hypothetical protein